MKPLALLLALLAALPLSAATISVSPSVPKAGDSVVVTVHDEFGSLCPATTQTVTLTGHTITIDLVPTAAGCAAVCPAVVVPIAVTTQPLVLAEAQPYTIEYAVSNCNGTRSVVASKQVLVRPQCAFDRSLTASASDLVPDNVVTFRWCDPSYSPFPDFGESATAYRVYLLRDGEAPMLVHQQKASAQPSASIRIAATETGVSGAFVEADVCDITIAGCTGVSKVLKSNVVPLSVGATRRRRATGN